MSVEGMDVFLAGKAYSLAPGAGPCCPADPVHIVLRVLGEVVVDHVRHSIYMESPARHISCHKDRQRTVPEPGEHLHPFPLVKVSGNSSGRETIGVQDDDPAAQLRLWYYRKRDICR